MKYHPDRWVNATDAEKKDAEEKFKEIAEAYEVLSDSQKRYQYDNGFTDFTFSHETDPMEMFRRMQETMGGFGDFFGDGGLGSFFGGRGQRRQQKRGSNCQTIVTVSLEEAYNGCDKEVTYTKLVRCDECNGTGSADGTSSVCPHCNGSGSITQTTQFSPGSFSMRTIPCEHCHGTGKLVKDPCKKCHGDGLIPTTVTETITIPPGVSDGLVLVAQGFGNESQDSDGINGDLNISVTVLKHNYFERPDDVNLIHYEKVPFNEALLGINKEFKCIDGSTVNVNSGELVPDGKAFVFKGKGMPHMRMQGMVGDYAVVIQYQLPKQLTDKQREMLRNFNN